MFIKEIRRRLRAVMGIVLVAPCLQSLAADNFPSRPITLVVPFAAGGGSDAMARTLARAMQSEWGQPVVVENRAGADGWVGTQHVLAQPADGYTILIQLNSMLLWRWAVPDAKIDFSKELRFISKVQSSPMVALVRGDAPANSLRELFDWCRKQPKPCNFGTSTPSAELVGRQLADAGGVTGTVTIPYKGTAPLVTDLLGGHIDLALVSATLAVPLSNEGRAKVLGVGTPDRYPRLPAAPTFTQAGYPAQNGTTWYGVMVKSGTPDSVVVAISSAVQKAGRNPEVVAVIENQGGVPVFSTPAEFGSEVERDLKAIVPLGDKYLK